MMNSSNRNFFCESVSQVLQHLTLISKLTAQPEPTAFIHASVCISHRITTSFIRLLTWALVFYYYWYPTLLTAFLTSALRAWRRLVRAHQLLWEEILLQLQDRGVPVGEAQRMAGEVMLDFIDLIWRLTVKTRRAHRSCFAFGREQRQKEATKTAVVNSFPKDRDYRREAMQATAAPGFAGSSKCYI